MSRRARFVIQIASLPVLYLLSLWDSALFQIVVGTFILVGWPVSVAVAVLLNWLAASDGEIQSLRESADNATTLALIHTGLAVAGLIAILRVLNILIIQGTPVLVALAWALVLVVVPSLSWAQTLRRTWLPMLRRLRRGVYDPDRHRRKDDPA